MIILERCMWLAPYTHGSRHEVELTLDTKRTLAGMRVWNYNRYCSDGEEVLRGVRAIKIFLDEKLLGFWVRCHIYSYFAACRTLMLFVIKL